MMVVFFKLIFLATAAVMKREFLIEYSQNDKSILEFIENFSNSDGYQITIHKQEVDNLGMKKMKLERTLSSITEESEPEEVSNEVAYADELEKTKKIPTKSDDSDSDTEYFSLDSMDLEVDSPPGDNQEEFIRFYVIYRKTGTEMKLVVSNMTFEVKDKFIIEMYIHYEKTKTRYKLFMMVLSDIKVLLKKAIKIEL